MVSTLVLKWLLKNVDNERNPTSCFTENYLKFVSIVSFKCRLCGDTFYLGVEVAALLHKRADRKPEAVGQGELVDGSWQRNVVAVGVQGAHVTTLMTITAPAKWCENSRFTSFTTIICYYDRFAPLDESLPGEHICSWGRATVRSIRKERTLPLSKWSAKPSRKRQAWTTRSPRQVGSWTRTISTAFDRTPEAILHVFPYHQPSVSSFFDIFFFLSHTCWTIA